MILITPDLDVKLAMTMELGLACGCVDGASNSVDSIGQENIRDRSYGTLRALRLVSRRRSYSSGIVVYLTVLELDAGESCSLGLDANKVVP